MNVTEKQNDEVVSCHQALEQMTFLDKGGQTAASQQPHDLDYDSHCNGPFASFCSTRFVLRRSHSVWWPAYCWDLKGFGYFWSDDEGCVSVMYTNLSISQ